MKKIENKDEWNSKVLACTDYNFYQSYEWGQVKNGEGWSSDRFLYEVDGKYSLAQCFIKKMIGIKLVWIPGGPLLSQNCPISVLSGFMERLNKHYSDILGAFCLKLNCQITANPEISLKFRELGYQEPHRKVATSFTCIADKKYFNDIEQRLSQNWKRNYKRSQRGNFTFDFRHDIIKISEIMKIYDETTELKGIVKTKSMHQIERLYENYDDQLISFFVYKGDELQSARIVIQFGNRVFDYLAATTIEGRKNYASYFLVYNILKWCADNDIEMFDFCGVDPLSAKGVYHFKSGTGARLVEFIGEKEMASTFIVKKMFDFGMWLKGFRSI